MTDILCPTSKDVTQDERNRNQTEYRWEFEQNYGKILATIIVETVREIEERTGRRVMTLVVPKPATWNDPDKHPNIQVRLGDSVQTSPRNTRCRYHGNKGNWFMDWFRQAIPKKPKATPEPAGG